MSEGMSEGISSAPSAAELPGSHDEVEPNRTHIAWVEPSKLLMDGADVG